MPVLHSYSRLTNEARRTQLFLKVITEEKVLEHTANSVISYAL